MLTLKNGDRLKLVAIFQHRGAAFSGAQIYAALGKRSQPTLLFPQGQFDEKLVGRGSITGIIQDANWTNYTVDVIIPIINVGTLMFPAGSDYEVYAKIVGIPGGDIFWYGPENDITLEAPLAAGAEFANLNVTYSKV